MWRSEQVGNDTRTSNYSADQELAMNREVYGLPVNASEKPQASSDLPGAELIQGGTALRLICWAGLGPN